MTPRLSQATLARRMPGIAAPAYDRGAVAPGIVHFGPGAFARAHLASYVEALLPADPRWGIAGIALRHGALAADLAAQDFLYVLAELDVPPGFRVVGALKGYVAAPADRARALACLDHPAARLVTITVSEKGYCLNAAGALDGAHPDIAHDLANPSAPVSLIGWLAQGLERRRLAGRTPFVTLSCDNVASNGVKLQGAVLAYARVLGRGELARWIEGEARFPSTMVDSITPASDAALGERVAGAVGLADSAPVQRESFAQWVIEDTLGPDMPDLAAVGAQMTSDVHAYEQAKLRLLNGTHSALAYLGLLRGHATVGGAMADAGLAVFVERLMREDIAPTLAGARGLEIAAYIGALLRRLRNPAVSHRLIQIAADGSLKLPYRFLEPIADLLRLGRPVTRPCVPVAAWMRFVVAAARRGEPLSDPLAAMLAAVGAGCSGAAAHDVPRFLGLTEIFPRDLAAEPLVIAAIAAAYDALEAATL
ncbi:MAG TPA: mannitol dehydrogenase family protein [Rhizomicrobium sp.]|jgi:fructuronate reductase|nr:mannitol dehydrogenase family protein [Rhizomicrobium sp.]